jgi:hypothetical protein
MSKAKTVKVRWNGAKEDPDTIVQHGVTFNKGEWTDVPVESESAADAGRTNQALGGPVKMHPHQHRLAKLKSNPWFEVKGEDADEKPSTGTATGGKQSSQPHTGTARAAVTTFAPVAQSNGRGKPKTWVIEGKNAVTGASVPGPTDEYADEASAQVVCDGLNQVAP